MTVLPCRKIFLIPGKFKEEKKKETITSLSHCQTRNEVDTLFSLQQVGDLHKDFIHWSLTDTTIEMTRWK